MSIMSNNLTKYTINIVGVVGIFGLTTGIYGGLKQWLYWFSYHTPIKFVNKKLSFLEPLANTSVVSGNLIYEVFYHGIASTLTAITFPISIPILLNYCEQSKDNEDTIKK